MTRMQIGRDKMMMPILDSLILNKRS